LGVVSTGVIGAERDQPDQERIPTTATATATVATPTIMGEMGSW
jgi:hypothetical protein